MKPACPPSPSENPPALTDRDYEPVRSLIAEARQRRHIATAIVTWQNAFTLFRQIERRIGLPGESDRDAYLAIVHDLQASGHHLLHLAAQGGIDTEREADIRPEDFRACLEMLEIDAGAEALAKDAPALGRFEDYFASQ
jgi:hypothetical protein